MNQIFDGRSWFFCSRTIGIDNFTVCILQKTGLEILFVLLFWHITCFSSGPVPGLSLEQQQMLLNQVQRQQQQIQQLQQQVQQLSQEKQAEEQAPVFVAPPPKTQSLRHSEAYLRYYLYQIKYLWRCLSNTVKISCLHIWRCKETVFIGSLELYYCTKN